MFKLKVVLYLLIIVFEIRAQRDQKYIDFSKFNYNQCNKNISNFSNSDNIKKKLFSLAIFEGAEMKFEKYTDNYAKYQFVVIPTLSIDSTFNCDSIFFPIDVIIFRGKKYQGEYFNNKLDVPMSESNLDKYASNGGLYGNTDNERYNKITREKIAKKVKKMKPSFIFTIREVNHTYFFVKNKKLFMIDLPTLNITPLGSSSMYKTD